MYPQLLSAGRAGAQIIVQETTEHFLCRAYTANVSEGTRIFFFSAPIPALGLRVDPSDLGRMFADAHNARDVGCLTLPDRQAAERALSAQRSQGATRVVQTGWVFGGAPARPNTRPGSLSLEQPATRSQTPSAFTPELRNRVFSQAVTARPQRDELRLRAATARRACGGRPGCWPRPGTATPQ